MHQLHNNFELQANSVALHFALPTMNSFILTAFDKFCQRIFVRYLLRSKLDSSWRTKQEKNEPRHKNRGSFFYGSEQLLFCNRSRKTKFVLRNSHRNALSTEHGAKSKSSKHKIPHATSSSTTDIGFCY